MIWFVVENTLISLTIYQTDQTKNKHCELLENYVTRWSNLGPITNKFRHEENPIQVLNNHYIAISVMPLYILNNFLKYLPLK